ncbi:Olfactory receptor 2T8 [Heterocephalus glaber]|uniref:Olfactory receptor 2T8 n=1 Tax=Heterocephalus glaber TaxID=10181 RepID=G5B0F9_HETGA|nr:Olfactory receptor 2T8 [Heterocephalus glaber]
MSYDCYVAVCQPLRYPSLMSGQLCLQINVGSWFLGPADGLMQAATTLSFTYCSTQDIEHFFCEAPTLVCLACSDTSVSENVMYIRCILILLIPLSLILMFYSFILAAVLHMHSTEAHKKALPPAPPTWPQWDSFMSLPSSPSCDPHPTGQVTTKRWCQPSTPSSPLC